MDALELMSDAETCDVDINLSKDGMPTTFTYKDKEGNVTVTLEGWMGFSKYMCDKIMFKTPEGYLGLPVCKEFKIPG